MAAMATILKIWFERLIQKAVDSKLGRTYHVDIDKKIAKIVLIQYPRWPSFENLFGTSSPEWKCQLTRNMLESIKADCR